MPNPRTAAEWAEDLVTIEPSGQLGQGAYIIKIGRELVGTAVNRHWAEEEASKLRLEVRAALDAYARQQVEAFRERVQALAPPEPPGASPSLSGIGYKQGWYAAWGDFATAIRALKGTP